MLFCIAAVVFTPFLAVTSDHISNYAVALLGIGILAGLSFLPDRRYLLKIAPLLFILLVQGTIVMINHGVHGIGSLYFVITVAFTTMFFGRIAGLLTTLVALTLTLAAYNLTYQETDLITSRSWFWQPISTAAACIVITLSSDYLMSGLVNALKSTQKEKAESD